MVIALLYTLFRGCMHLTLALTIPYFQGFLWRHLMTICSKNSPSTLDGSLKQHGKGTEMRMSPGEAISYVEEYFPLCEGDIVFTGTPAGVGRDQARPAG